MSRGDTLFGVSYQCLHCCDQFFNVTAYREHLEHDHPHLAYGREGRHIFSSIPICLHSNIENINYLKCSDHFGEGEKLGNINASVKGSNMNCSMKHDIVCSACLGDVSSYEVKPEPNSIKKNFGPQQKKVRFRETNFETENVFARDFHDLLSKSIAFCQAENDFDTLSQSERSMKTGSSRLTYKAIPSYQISDLHDDCLLDSLSRANQAVLAERQHRREASYALYAAQDLLSDLQSATEDRKCEENAFIADLIHQLSLKDEQISKFMCSLANNGTEQMNKSFCKDNHLVIEEHGYIGSQEINISNLEVCKQDIAIPSDDEILSSAVRSTLVSKMQDCTRFNHISSNVSSLGFLTPFDLTFHSKIKQYDLANSANCTIESSHTHSEKTSDVLEIKFQHGNSTMPESSVLDAAHGDKLNKKQKALVDKMKNMLMRTSDIDQNLNNIILDKDNQVQCLSDELKLAMNAQNSFMIETYDFYAKAESNLIGLKKKLKEKEIEFEHRNLVQCSVQTKLQELLVRHDDMAKSFNRKNLLYQDMMSGRDKQMRALKCDLKMHQKDKRALNHVIHNLRHDIEEKDCVQRHLYNTIVSKDHEIGKINEELKVLSDFLKTAAVKETMAKVKLESFVLDLFDHADKTERELRYLGNMSTSHLGQRVPSLCLSSCQPTVDSILVDNSALWPNVPGSIIEHGLSGVGYISSAEHFVVDVCPASEAVSRRSTLCCNTCPALITCPSVDTNVTYILPIATAFSISETSYSTFHASLKPLTNAENEFSQSMSTLGCLWHCTSYACFSSVIVINSTFPGCICDKSSGLSSPASQRPMLFEIHSLKSMLEEDYLPRENIFHNYNKASALNNSLIRRHPVKTVLRNASPFLNRCEVEVASKSVCCCFHAYSSDVNASYVNSFRMVTSNDDHSSISAETCMTSAIHCEFNCRSSDDYHTCAILPIKTCSISCVIGDEAMDSSDFLHHSMKHHGVRMKQYNMEVRKQHCRSHQQDQCFIGDTFQPINSQHCSFSSLSTASDDLLFYQDDDISIDDDGIIWNYFENPSRIVPCHTDTHDSFELAGLSCRSADNVPLYSFELAGLSCRSVDNVPLYSLRNNSGNLCCINIHRRCFDNIGKSMPEDKSPVFVNEGFSHFPSLQSGCKDKYMRLSMSHESVHGINQDFYDRCILNRQCSVNSPMQRALAVQERLRDLTNPHMVNRSFMVPITSSPTSFVYVTEVVSLQKQMKIDHIQSICSQVITSNSTSLSKSVMSCMVFSSTASEILTSKYN